MAVTVGVVVAVAVWVVKAVDVTITEVGVAPR